MSTDTPSATAAPGPHPVAASPLNRPDPGHPAATIRPADPAVTPGARRVVVALWTVGALLLGALVLKSRDA